MLCKTEHNVDANTYNADRQTHRQTDTRRQNRRGLIVQRWCCRRNSLSTCLFYPYKSKSQPGLAAALFRRFSNENSYF